MAGGMDFRILIAVFITLFGIAIAMEGGELESDQLWDSIGSADVPDDISSFLDFEFGGLFASSEPEAMPANTSFSAKLTTPGTELSIQRPATVTIQLDAETPLTVGDTRITPGSEDESVSMELRGFTGMFSTSETVELDGSIDTIDTDALSMNYSDPKQLSAEDVPADTIHVDELERQDVSFDNATGTIATGSSDISVENESASFESFKGSIDITAVDDSYQYRMDGKLYQGLIQDGDSTITIGG